MLTLSNKEARHLILANQGLAKNFFGSKKDGVLKAIEHLGYIQIDTISVVERAHHHTLWSRVPDYKKKYLDDLVEKDKSVFEYWSHAAAFLPMRDFRYSLVRKNLFIKNEKLWYANKKVLKFVYDRIKNEGPLQSKDFEEKKTGAGWWQWKDTKRALEQLFMEGKLMSAKRQGFQKVYDITERVLPAGVNVDPPTDNEYAAYLIGKSIRANGIVAASEISYLRPHAKKSVNTVLKEMVEAREIIPVTISGNGKDNYYTNKTSLDLAASIKPNKYVQIINPFDNSVIQRNRLKSVFGFDYTIECYVPEPKRKYGYFCLPVLMGDEFVGRIDCKAERNEKVLYVKAMYYENGYKRSKELKNGLQKALQKFAAFNSCETLKFL